MDCAGIALLPEEESITSISVRISMDTSGSKSTGVCRVRGCRQPDEHGDSGGCVAVGGGTSGVCGQDGVEGG